MGEARNAYKIFIGIILGNDHLYGRENGRITLRQTLWRLLRVLWEVDEKICWPVCGFDIILALVPKC
jgi:hypothetical protein